MDTVTYWHYVTVPTTLNLGKEDDRVYAFFRRVSNTKRTHYMAWTYPEDRCQRFCLRKHSQGSLNFLFKHLFLLEESLPNPSQDNKLGSTDASPDEGVVEDMPMIDEKAVEQLTEGLISHYLPDLQRSKLALKELTQNQVVLLETLEQEISKFKECNSILDINALFSEAKHYHNKLVNIRNEMMMLHEKTSKLKKRALKLQQKRQKEELEREQQREKELEREKQLTAKPARRT
nr:PREDICTED: biogenesis of lysosome-related organelles complex 1 subunit 6 [Apteryx mantelli mantelli]